jgi:hypothetical protein
MSKPEWDGEGLPPVGTVCEYTKPDGFRGRERVWYWCKVVAHDYDGAVIRTDKNKYHLRSLDEYEFRPIRATKEVERDELIKLIGDNSPLNTNGHYIGGVVEAIQAAGYRKQGDCS